MTSSSDIETAGSIHACASRPLRRDTPIRSRLHQARATIPPAAITRRFTTDTPLLLPQYKAAAAKNVTNARSDLLARIGAPLITKKAVYNTVRSSGGRTARSYATVEGGQCCSGGHMTFRR